MEDMSGHLLQLQTVLVKAFSFDELLNLASEFGVNFGALPGATKTDKVREFVVHLHRRNRLRDLEEYVVQNRQEFRPHIEWLSVVRDTRGDQDEGLAKLSIELLSMRQKLAEITDLQKGSVSSEEFERRIQDVLVVANRAIEHSEELSARIILPPAYLTDVYLVPTHSLDRLEEYRSDENGACLLIGAFGGAVLGILANWVTSDPFVITPSSGVLMVLCAVLTIACSFWARRLKRRANLVKNQFFSWGTWEEEA